MFLFIFQDTRKISQIHDGEKPQILPELDCHSVGSILFFKVDSLAKRQFRKIVSREISGTVFFFIVFGFLLLQAGWGEGNVDKVPKLTALEISNADHQAGDYHAMAQSLVQSMGRNQLLHNPALGRWEKYAKKYANKEFSFDGGVDSSNGDAMTFLGYNFYFLGVDYISEAVAFFARGAELGNKDSQYQLGMVYLHGRGEIEPNAGMARQLLEEAAAQGVSEAMNTLGDMIENQTGVGADKTASVIWYEKASELGDALAQNNLGRLYSHGELVDKDHKKAFNLYKQAAEGGLDWAMHNLGLCHKAGEGVPADTEKAIFYLERAGNEGFGKSFLVLGDMYRTGEGVEADSQKAFYFYQKAEETGNIQAKSALGYMYYTGEGVNQSNAEALSYWIQAAHAGDIYAQINLADMYLLGEGVQVNPAKALRWLKKARDQGSAEAGKRILELGVTEMPETALQP